VSQESIRVLVVDDLPQVRQGLAIVLELAGKAAKPMIDIVGEAQNGSEAIEQAQALHPDVVLMDLEMPVLDGYAATQCIKSTHPSIVIIALTIHSDVVSRQKAAQAGADSFVEKGAPLDELVQAIQRFKRTS
jgi:two-component system, NarL family, response regulator LiaR